jgi:hypothetical protein
MHHTDHPTPELYELRLLANCAIHGLFLLIGLMCFTFQGVGLLVAGCAVGWIVTLVRVSVSRRKVDA